MGGGSRGVARHRIQHRAGMAPWATPIFELVDFGVVGDLHTVLPAVTEEVNKRKG